MRLELFYKDKMSAGVLNLYNAVNAVLSKAAKSWKVSLYHFITHPRPGKSVKP